MQDWKPGDPYSWPRRESLPSTDGIWLGHIIEACWIEGHFASADDLASALEDQHVGLKDVEETVPGHKDMILSSNFSPSKKIGGKGVHRMINCHSVLCQEWVEDADFGRRLQEDPISSWVGDDSPYASTGMSCV